MRSKNITVPYRKTYEWHRKRRSLAGVDPLQQGIGIGELMEWSLSLQSNEYHHIPSFVVIESIFDFDDFVDVQPHTNSDRLNLLRGWTPHQYFYCEVLRECLNCVSICKHSTRACPTPLSIETAAHVVFPC